MDRNVTSIAREQSLRREEAKLTLGAVVAPVTLERKVISMINPPSNNQVPVETPPEMTSSNTTITAPSVSATSANTALRDATVSPVVGTAATVAATDAASIPSRSIVGGKHPLGEEIPFFLMLQQQQQKQTKQQHQQQQDDEQTETSWDLAESDSSSSQKQAAPELARLLQLQPEDAIRTLSTNQTTIERGRELGRKRLKPAVQFSDVSPKRDVSHVMNFFQEQEEHLQQSFLSLPKRSQKMQRSPSPRLQHAAGLEHLDNLIRLMEQLTSLKDENNRLRKRCDFLESTKTLLEAKRDLCFDSTSSPSGIVTLSPRQHHRHHDQHHHHVEKETPTPRVDTLALVATAGRLSRPRISSAEELEYLELADASSDQTPKKAKATMHKRSFSTGSLEVPSEMRAEVGGMDTRKRKGKSQRRIFGKSSGSKQKSKGSKWARVKKVLTGQKIYEDLGTTIRTIRDLGRSSHVSYSSSATHGVMSTSDSRMSTSDSRMSTLDSRMSSSGPHPPVQDSSQSHDISGARTGLTVSVLQSFQEAEDADLTSEIWMGPPGWWEEYQASRDKDGTSTNSEVSSVIEVTTMYLGSKQETTAATATSTATTATSTAATATSTAPLRPTTTTTITAPLTTLTIERPLARRQSSPSLVMKELAEEDDVVQELATSLEATRLLHKSSSCKSADLDIQNFGEGKQSKKSHRSAWGRVKDIIHTRKDSIKRKPKRGKTGVDSEELSEVDVDIEDHWSSDVFDDGLLGRSTPKSSPMVIRQQSAKNDSGAGLKPSPSRLLAQVPGSGPSSVDMATLLVGNVSTEFNKKMQQWEEMRRKKSTFRVSLDEREMASLDVTEQLPETRTIPIRILEPATEVISLDDCTAELDILGAPTMNVEEIHRGMTDSFSRKMQNLLVKNILKHLSIPHADPGTRTVFSESPLIAYRRDYNLNDVLVRGASALRPTQEWEKLKYRSASRTAREASPEGDKKETKARKDDRQKSKRSREEKEKEKWERQREREMQKVEREQVKLEKEKQRLEKERLRTLEREAKLEKLKGRLSQVDIEGSWRNPGLGHLAEYKVTTDFARKLHQWELKKGLSHDVSNSIYLQAHNMSMQHLTTGGTVDQYEQDQSREQPDSGDRPPGMEKASPPPPLALPPYWDSPESSSPVEKYSEASLADDEDTCTSVTEECLTRSNISSLERANKELLDSLQKKELEYAAVQEQVRKVNDKLATVRENHTTEMARFHRELARGNLSGPVNLQVEELESTVGDLEQRIHMMENLGETLASSMESAAIGKWQSIEGEEAVHTQLVELVDQMRQMLFQASQSEEQSQKSMALTNFETLYTQAMKLQVQMNNLRLSHLERNREIMLIKRQLLLQEVNNLLLQADITRRETELYQFHQAKRFPSLKRWNTFSGAERHRPHTQVEDQITVKPGQQQNSWLRPSEKTETLVLACLESASISAPASPLYVTSVGKSSTDLVSGPADKPRAAGEASTDHKETHLVVSAAVTRRDRQLRPTTGSRLQANHSTTTGSRLQANHSTTTGSRLQANHSTTNISVYEAMGSLQLPKLSIHMSPRTHEAPCAFSPASLTAESLAAESVAASLTASSTAASLAAAPTTTTIANVTAHKSPSAQLTTTCDSVPLHMQIEQLKRQKRKVEKGPPTLKKSEYEVLSAAPSPGKVPQPLSSIEAPNLTIPEQPGLATARLATTALIVDDDNSLAPPVIECTESLHIFEQTDGELGAARVTSPRQPAAEKTQPTSDQSLVGCTFARSPVNKHALPGHREGKDVTIKDYKAISPQGSPVAARGKPPLPRHVAGVSKQPPTSCSASGQGPRSKSVSDMEHRMLDSKMSTSLQEVINRFEKRATVCEGDDHPTGLRKTPSPTLHLARVGLVCRVRRLKPAAELLEESQRYRSGHSICATRIVHRYLSKEEHKPDASRTTHKKEQASGNCVQAIVYRQCRETTPVQSRESPRRNSDVEFKPSNCSRVQSVAVADTIEKITARDQRSADEQAAAGSSRALMSGASRSQERTLSDWNIDRQQQLSSTTKPYNRRSCEVAIELFSTQVSPTSYQIASLKLADSSADSSQKPGSSISASSHKSLPAISAGVSEHVGSAEETIRTRAATYCMSDIARSAATGRCEVTQPAGKGELPQSIDKGATVPTEMAHFNRLPSPVPTDSRVGQMGTVGVLCKQSISFDLGISKYSQQAHRQELSTTSRQVHSWDPSDSSPSPVGHEQGLTSTPALSPATSICSDEAKGEQRAVSTSSEGEMAPSSPSFMEKKKSRRFLHSDWLQKSKQFFKVSK